MPALVASAFLPVSFGLYLALADAVIAVLIVECDNFAIEAAVDLACSQPHPLAKIAKDCASAAVFLTICATMGVWGAVLWAWLFAKKVREIRAGFASKLRQIRI